jgi:hypothetical protein
MLTTNARRARRLAGWAGVVCAALLATACNSNGSVASGPVTPPSSVAVSSAPASSAPATAPVTGPTASSTFLAQGQDINGTVLHMPVCDSGCALSGDSTAILDKMTWNTWSGSEAVGTGTYELDGCNPNCAAGSVYKVPAVVTLSNPVKACSSSGTRYFWTRATFQFPDGLPAALQGESAPQNPWVFSPVATAAQQSCTS